MKKILSLLLAMCMLFGVIGVVSADERADVFDSTTIDTTVRGYQIIDGNVCDLDGNLLIKLENGFTEDGYSLDPDFSVNYGKDAIGMEIENLATSESVLAATSIFNGTANLPINIDGNQGVQVGSNFTVSAGQPNVKLYYTSGTPSGVNIAVHNVSRNTIVDWVSNVKPGGNSGNISVYNSSRPNDTYKAVCSAQGTAGTATIKVDKL